VIGNTAWTRGERDHSSLRIFASGHGLVEDGLNVRSRASAGYDVDHIFRLTKREPARAKH